jgi:hypothetical protein
MIWGEQELRDIVHRRQVIGAEQLPEVTLRTATMVALIDELDRYREALRQLHELRDLLPAGEAEEVRKLLEGL